MFGVCREHEPDDIRRTFIRAVTRGLAHPKKPACFRSDDEYREYTVAALLTGHASRGVTTKINYCRDCTPDYKREMLESGQCSHPETVFIREAKTNSGDVIGVPVGGPESTRVWEQAVMGMMGQVVSMPSCEAVGAVLSRLTEDGKPKRGRPPKKREGE